MTTDRPCATDGCELPRTIDPWSSPRNPVLADYCAHCLADLTGMDTYREDRAQREERANVVDEQFEKLRRRDW